MNNFIDKGKKPEKLEKYEKELDDLKKELHSTFMKKDNSCSIYTAP
jgi:uncharacterized protein Yka (UPF0111/DUF47 family)